MQYRIFVVLAVFLLAHPALGEPHSRPADRFPFKVICLQRDADQVQETAAADLQSSVKRQFGVQLEIKKFARGVALPDNAVHIAVEAAPGAGPDREIYEIRGSGSVVSIKGNRSQATLQAIFWIEEWLTRNPGSGMASLNVKRTARFGFRAAMPYFTEAGEVTDEYLRFVAASGYNAFYLEFNPFEQYIQDPIFFPISQIFRVRDFVNVPGKERLIAYTNDVFARAKKYGLDCYLYVMEPWGGDAAFAKAHPEAIGSNRNPHLTRPLCLDSPVAVDYLRDMSAQLARNIPDLKGIIVMSEDGTTICDDSCPRSKGARSERRAALFRTLAEGGKSVRRDFRIIAYTWWWDPQDFPVVIGQLPRDSIVCTRTSTRAPFELDPAWKGTPGDVSLIVDGPGPDFQDAVKYARQAGLRVVDMLAVSNGHELITLPVMPAPDRYARKLDVLEKAGGDGWIIYDCGGLTRSAATRVMAKGLWAPADSVDELVREVADEIYGSGAAKEAVEGWKLCSAALQWFPVEQDKTTKTPHRNSASMSALAPAVPLTVAGAFSYRHFFSLPSGPGENLLNRDWGNFWDDREVMYKYLTRLQDGLEKGVGLLDRAAEGRTDAARQDARDAKAALISVLSGLNLLRFWEQLVAGGEATTPESQASVIGRVLEITAAERENTREMLSLVKRDRRLFYCACSKYFHPQYISGGFVSSGYIDSRMTIAQILEKKLEVLNTEDFRGRLEQAFSGCCTTQVQLLWASQKKKDK